jgi:hypothetical protein
MKPAGRYFELDAAEIDLAMKVGNRASVEFAVIGQAVIKTAAEAGIPDHIIASAICTEALLLAACFHKGTPESFLVMATHAIAAAAERGAGEPATKRAGTQ